LSRFLREETIMLSRRTLSLLLILLVVLFAFGVAQRGMAITYTVVNTNDSGNGSLRWAISGANIGAGNTITFNIPPTDPGCSGGVCTIQPLSALPSLTGDGATIDGYTQPGSLEATSGSPAVITIVVDGSSAGTGSDGLLISADDSVVKGLVINQFDEHGIYILGDRNVIRGCYIGTDSSGTLDQGNGFSGVSLNNAADNTIGGSTPAERNVISGNDSSGVSLANVSATGNIVSGNYIGTDAAGTAAIPNADDGVHISLGANGNTVGGDTAGEGNLISGNDGSGVLIAHTNSSNNVISGNLIGTDVAGLLDRGNAEAGVSLGAWTNTVGGTTTAERNLISGNDQYGVFLSPDGRWNEVIGNYIGTDISGDTALGGQMYGLYVAGGSNNTLGGSITSKRNVISGNVFGVVITGSTAQNNFIIGNFIGLNPAGSAAVGNSGDGVWIKSGAHDNQVGGGSLGQRNIISGNSYGVSISGSGSSSNTVAGNLIGTDSTGALDLGNDTGVRIFDQATSNTIGGDSAGSRNVISGNDENGVMLYDDGTRFNVVSGNYIGVDLLGTSPLGNGWSGVRIDTTAKDNTIGGSSAGEANVISDNDRGVFIFGDWSADNVVQGNLIGTDATGSIVIGNDRDGVRISGGAKDNTIGPDNVITGSGWDGVIVSGATTIGNVITQNQIYGNTLEGIHLDSGGNHSIAAPTIYQTSVGSVYIEGNAPICSYCTVEVYGNKDTDGEGEVYLGTTSTDGIGVFVLMLPRLDYPYLTATVMEAFRGTSEFSDVYTSTIEYIYLPLILR
jgi:hypothetical protein